MNKQSYTKPLLKFKLREVLHASEWYFLSVIAFYTVLALLFFSQIPIVTTILFENILLTLLLITIATLSKYKAGSLFTIVHRYYHLPIIYLVFIQVFSYISVLNPKDYDVLLVQWDKALFGVNPTEWLLQLSNPVLTEFMQIAYVLFFFHAFSQSVELNIRGMYKQADTVTRTIVFGFLLSYLLYFFLPAIGPRFSIHEYDAINTELPGLLLTEPLRLIIDSGDGVKDMALNAASQVHRNCMPSGHTMMTLMNMILAFRFRSKLRWIFLFMGSSLIFATMYLRYHYVVDVLAGIVCALIALWIEPRLFSLLVKKKIVLE